MLDQTQDFHPLRFELPKQTVLTTFDDLKDDPYLRGGFAFRKRSYSTGQFSKGNLDWAAHSSFFQSVDINDYAGGISREFPPMSETFKSFVQQLLFDDQHQKLVAEKHYNLGAHQIRIICEKDNPGFPVPEGPHQDGFDFVGLYCLSVVQADGGETQLFKYKKDGDCVYKRTMSSGEGVMLNDKTIFHYTSPINLTYGEVGYRDICVITFKEV